ncbi:MAG TPA: NAD(P)-dependent oxidoreductase [Candidatus Binataceae bacterium]|nr:NAD(P)-dependent oxidoreductase [Candidatus Binataceae bacterium]
MEIGFIGLGEMGSPMALNLIGGGYRVTVWNRTASKAEPHAARGARVAAKPGEVVRSGGVVITMLADDPTLEAVTLGDGGIAAALGKGGVHISMSTVAPATTRKLAEVHRAAGSTMIAAPVFGRPEAAAAKRLWICTSGPAAAKNAARPIFDALGQGIFDFGEPTEAANVAKISGNFLIAAAMEAMGEAFAMAEKSGLDRVALATMLGQTLFACPVYQGYGAAIAHRRHTPAGFRLPLGLKDVEIVLRCAREANAPMPTASLLRDRFVHALAVGRQELDWSAVALGAREDAGLKE